MAAKPKLSKSRIRLSPQSLEKLFQTQKNICKSPPRLWLDNESNDLSDVDHQGLPILKQSHPILRALDSVDVTFKQFNQVHSQLIVSGLFQHPLSASRAVKKLCSSRFTVSHAVELFHRLDDPDAFICNTIMRSYVNFNDSRSSLSFYYHQMVGKCIPPNHYTFPILAKACAGMNSVTDGEKIHAHVVKFGFELDLFVRNAFIHMYSVCKRIWDAKKVFNLNPESDLVTWNSMIDGYVKNGEVGFARWIFDEIPERDVFSWNTMITAYSGIGDMEAARKLFENMPKRDVVSWNCLIDGFARNWHATDALMYFEQMARRNVVSWNTLLALYVRSKDYGECLTLFDRMVEEGDVKPNEATLLSVLTACANLGRLDMGKWVHNYIENDKTIKPDVLLSTALLTMYAKCGALDLAKDVFDKIPEKNVVSWNSIITGYGMHGCGEKALEMFLEMEKSGMMPNEATFICILSACTHAGMVLEGWWYLDKMCKVYKIEPKVEHYGCMVDLLGRAGFMEDCKELIRKIPEESGPSLWGALLSSCRTHSNLALGEIVAKRLIESEPEDIGSYVLLSNIYAAEGRWNDVENVRKMMIERGLQKVAGSSVVHFGDSVFDSSNESLSVHKRRMVYSLLREMGTRMKLSCGNIVS